MIRREHLIMARTALARVAPGMSAGKVFAIGLNKTGSSSIDALFRELGLRAYHAVGWRDTDDLRVFYRFDAFSDGPPKDFRKLDRVFPGSKFILQVRDFEGWADSRIEHIRRADPARVEAAGPYWRATEEAVAMWARHRDAYHLEVIEHFRGAPDRFLLVNYIRDPEAAAKIRRFLGRPPAAEKPKVNANPAGARGLRNREMIAAALTRLGVPKAEWSNDVLFPSLTPDHGDAPADTRLLAAGGAA